MTKRLRSGREYGMRDAVDMAVDSFATPEMQYIYNTTSNVYDRYNARRNRVSNRVNSTPRRYRGVAVRPRRNRGNTRRTEGGRRQKYYRVTGRYAGRFKRPRKDRKNLLRMAKKIDYSTKGIVNKVESRGAFTDTDCCYLGHTIATETLLLNVCRLVVKDLYKLFKVDVTSFEVNVDIPTGSVHTIHYNFYADETQTTPNNVNFTYSNTDTYTSVAQTLLTAIRGAWNQEQIPESFVLATLDGGTTSNRIDVASIKCSQYRLAFDIRSYLKVQNRTKAGVGTEDELTTNIENNPIHGKLYAIRGWSNRIVPKDVEGLGGTYGGFVGNVTTGVIQTGYEDMAGIESMRQPPPGWQFDARSTSVKLAPGAIKYDKMVFQTVITLPNFMRKFTLPLSTTSRRNVQFGRTRILGLEKLLDSGAAEPEVALGYEVDQVYKVASMYKRSRTLPINTVN